jgi:glycosyltransferase involved in cell wall biosynthesis
MHGKDPRQPVVRAQAPCAPPLLLMGITHPQTCLVLHPRIRALREAGFRIVLVASPGELLEHTALTENVECVAIPMRRGIAPLADLVSLFRLWRLLGGLRPDVVEFSTPKAGLLGSLAAMLRRIPRRVYLLRGLKLETSRGWRRQLLLAAERFASACAHVVLCNSASLRAQARALSLAPPAKLRLLGEGSSKGVDVDRFSPGKSSVRNGLGWSKSALVVGYVGRLTRDKGIPELVEAFESILCARPDARLLLVGWFDASADALDNDLRSRIEQHPRIHCTGYVEDTVPYYRAMDVMVLPTWREGFPNAVLEAQATGIPVVTTFSTGARDSVLPEVTGLLIPAGNPQAICEAVRKLCEAPGLRRRMGATGRAWVREHYLERSVLRFTAEFYRKFLEGGNSPSKIQSPLPNRSLPRELLNPQL